MNLIEFLREKLTPIVEQKIGSFLGEPQPNVITAIQSVLPTILGGLIQQGTTDEGAKKVMDIIKDGGHTGDVLNNISGLLDNYDKSQLLVTIGSNIFNHFFGNTAVTLTDKIASLSKIKSSSAASLLGLMAPMVLGAIGYVVHKENLGISGLKKLLDEQREDVSKALPPLIAPHLPLRAIVPSPVQETDEGRLTNSSSEEKAARPYRKRSKKKSGDKSFANTFLPWLFLIILALLSAYYLRSCQVSSGDADFETTSINEAVGMDKLTGILDDSSAVVEGGDRTVPFSTGDNTTGRAGSNSATPNTQDTTPASEGLESSRTPVVTAQQLRNAPSWVEISSGSFKSNSAEISNNNNEINTISSFLQQNPNATVSIAPAGNGRVSEDRAYAIREQLYQKGVDISRIIIEPARGSGNGVSIKVNR
jgi:outer membrane protein OmpA-like peptidoglycan-associated protein